MEIEITIQLMHIQNGNIIPDYSYSILKDKSNCRLKEQQTIASEIEDRLSYAIRSRKA